MGVDAEELFIRPFREIVERGNDAITNAESVSDDDPNLSEQMAKAGKALVREGERAQKRLQPVWDSQVEKFGNAFRDALMQQSEIEQKRKILDDLLYDFEDYTEPDMFDVAKFTEIQGVCKALALGVLDTTKRLKLETPKQVEPSPVQALFPPLPPLPPIPKDDRQVASHLASRSPGRATNPRGSFRTRDSIVEDSEEIEVPIGQRLSDKVYSPSVGHMVQNGLRRIGTKSSTSSSFDYRNQDVGDKQPSSLDALSNGGNHFHVSTSANGPPSDASPAIPSLRTTSWVRKQTLPPGSRVNAQVRRKTSRDALTADSNYVGSLNSLTIDNPARANHSLLVIDPPASPELTDSRTSVFSNAISTPDHTSPVATPDIRPNDRRTPPLSHSPVDARDFNKFKDVPPVPPITLPAAQLDYDEGLMLAEETTDRSGATTNTNGRDFSREVDCIFGPSSSFSKLHGFCPGAELFRKSGYWQGVKRTMGFVDNQQDIVGVCVSCGYAHKYTDLSLDIEKKSKATFMTAGVRFRIRMLYKSHISDKVKSQKKLSGMYYACLFCVQTGSTAREGDATVFTNSDDLLVHLAHHPQPLPAVPGISVLYGDIASSDSQRDDFDLHFPRPPVDAPEPPAVGKSAVATAVKDHVQQFGVNKLDKPPSHGGELLLFLAGARIVGVTFPMKWGGKWCTGWHDGKAGAFPAKMVEIEPPRQSEIPMESSSGMSVTTRWKWKPVKKDDGSSSVWLEFDKGETISNVRCLYADHWCWSGTNAKGKYGVFPQSHIITDTVQQDTIVPLRADSKKPNRPRGFFSRRPVSSGGASSISDNTGRSDTF